jgi:hypothetical protein
MFDNGGNKGGLKNVNKKNQIYYVKYIPDGKRKMY